MKQVVSNLITTYVDMTQAEVTLSNYNPNWPDMFEHEKDILESIAGDWLTGSIEHIGSTAVAELIAKPVIDIMFGVESLESSTPAIDVITRNGYQYFPYKADIMHWFCKPSDKFRTHHLHLVPFQSELWNQRIRFRDILRSDDSISKRYGDLKKTLAETYPHDREAYTVEKWPFIKQVLSRVNTD